MYQERIYTYQPDQILVLVGQYVVSSLVSINISKDKPSFKTIKGIRGKNTRVLDTDGSYSVKLELLQADPVNDFLSTVHKLDTNEQNATYFAINISDKAGTTSFKSETAYIESVPDITFSDNFDNREWVIKTLDTQEVFLGGNYIER